MDVEPGLGDDFRQKGLRRASQFSWSRCAEQTLAIYREAMQSKHDECPWQRAGDSTVAPAPSTGICFLGHVSHQQCR
jgi:hypothetical protein